MLRTFKETSLCVTRNCNSFESCVTRKWCCGCNEANDDAWYKYMACPWEQETVSLLFSSCVYHFLRAGVIWRSSTFSRSWHLHLPAYVNTSFQTYLRPMNHDVLTEFAFSNANLHVSWQINLMSQSNTFEQYWTVISIPVSAKWAVAIPEPNWNEASCPSPWKWVIILVDIDLCPCFGPISLSLLFNHIYSSL